MQLRLQAHALDDAQAREPKLQPGSSAAAKVPGKQCKQGWPDRVTYDGV
jgi:hypothetical protein